MGSLEEEQLARSFFIMAIFFPWDYTISLVLTTGRWGGGETDWPVVVAISLRDLKTPGTVRGEGLNIVGCAPFDFYNQFLSI